MRTTLLLSLLVVSFVFSYCKKDETPNIITVSTEHKSFHIDFTATWCCPCGGAKPMFEDVQSKYPYKMISMSLHAQNDTFYVPTMFGYWANVYNVSGIPTMVGDNREVRWGYMPPSYELDTSDFYHLIDSTTSQPAKCGIGLAKTISGNTMLINTKTVFFDNVSGKYTLAIYVVESGLYYDQNCSPDDIHDNVFRACVNDPQGIGTVLANGSVTKGQAFDNTFTWTIPAGYHTDKLNLIGIVYQMGTAPKPVAILNVNKI